MNKTAIAGSALGVAVSAILGVATGIALYHAPESRQPAGQVPAAVVEQLDTTTPIDTPFTTVTPESSVTSSEQPSQSTATNAPAPDVTVLVGPPPTRDQNGEMHVVMPTGDAPTPTTEPNPIQTPEMPPGYMTSPQETPQETPTN